MRKLIKINVILLILIVIYPLFKSVERVVNFNTNKGYKVTTYSLPDSFLELVSNSLLLLSLFLGCVLIFYKREIGILLIRSSLLTLMIYLIASVITAGSFFIGYIEAVEIVLLILIVLSLFNLSNSKLTIYFKKQNIDVYKKWYLSIILSIIFLVLLLYVYW